MPPDHRRKSAWQPWVVPLGVALVLAGSGALLIVTGFESEPRSSVVGSNAPVNPGAAIARDISASNSPTLVRNPMRPLNLAVANRVDTPRFSCALVVSFDGGRRWTQTPLPAPASEEPKCYAPDVTFDADGTLYLSFVTLEGRGNVPSAAWIVRSEDGGRTLSAPTKVAGPLAFQVRLTADPAVSGRLYLTALRAETVGLFSFPQTGNPVMFTRSDDGGETWQPPLRVSARSRERVVAPSLTVGPEGRLFTVYLDLGDDSLDYSGAHGGRGGPPYPGTWQLVMARSDDHGVTWTESVVDDAVVPTERMIVFIPKFPSVAVDRDSGRAYVAYQNGRFGDPDVLLWRSADGGREWSSPVRVNDTPRQDGTTQTLPKLAVAPNGRLDVVYYDRRHDPDDVRTEVSLQSSFDRGLTFAPRQRLSDRAFDSRIGLGRERGLPDLGSRIALLSTDEVAMAVWADTRAGTRTTGKQDLARAVVAFSRPRRLSGAAKFALGAAGLMLAGGGLVLLAMSAIRRRTEPTP